MMAAPVLLIFILFFSHIAETFGLSQVMFQVALIHRNSLKEASKIIADVNWNKLSCSKLCLKSVACNAFHKSGSEGCVLLSNMDPRALVETSSMSQNAVTVYYKSPSPVPRNISEDPAVSPIIATYPQWHDSLGKHSAYVMEKDMTLTLVEENGGSQMFRWHFDTLKMEAIPLTIPVHGMFPLVASQNGIMFIHGGESYASENRVEFYTNNSFKTIAKPPQPLNRGCATMIPDDNYFVYLIGGRNSVSGSLLNICWEYDIVKDSYKELTRIPTPSNKGLARHGCTGIRTSSDKRAFVTIGGRLNSLNNGDEKLVYQYTVDNDFWENLTAYPLSISMPTVLYWKGFVYVFGGGGPSVSSSYRTIRRMSVSPGSTWEVVGVTDNNSERPVVVAYNA